MSQRVASSAITDPCTGERGPREPKDVVFTFSYVSWDGAQRRGMNFAQDRLVTRLLADREVARLLVGNPFRSGPRRLARRLLKGPLPGLPASSGASLHEPRRLRRADPTALAAVERAYRRYDESLRRASQRAGLHRPAVVTAHPLIAGFAPMEWASTVTFYCTDDWSAAPAYEPWWPAYREGYARIRARGHAVVAVSTPIIERIRPTGPHRVVPNGINSGEWQTPGPAPDWMQRLPRPIALYVGTLEGRLDRDALRATAEALDGGTVLLVGPVADAKHLAAVAKIPGVMVHPPVDRETLPAVISSADLGIIPHVRTRFTEAMSPLKAYEYLAGGRPVVATDLPPMRDLDARVVLVRDPRSFGLAVEDALRSGAQPEPERLAFVTENSWDRRHRAIMDVVMRDGEA